MKSKFAWMIPCWCLALALRLPAQFNTAIQDGVINPGEYGTHVNGINQQSEGGTTYFMAWDANNLYVAFTGSNFNEAAILYLDHNPFLPVNGGTDANGSLQGYYAYDRNHMMQPFRADFVLYYKNGYHEYRFHDGAGYWGPQTSNSLPLGLNAGSNTVEIAIPWNTITQGAGRPAAFNWFTYKTYDYGPGANGVYHALPLGNPTCGCNQDPSRLSPTRYYTVPSTGNGSSVAPFSLRSFTYYEDYSFPGVGGYYLSNASFYDVTIHDNSANNSDNDAPNRQYNNNDIANRLLVEGTITIAHDLYIGPGSALLPADNVSGAVLASLQFTGTDGHIYNYGRLDPNPEAAGFGDWTLRRIELRFLGTTRLQPTPIFKDNYRFGDVFITAGASLLGPLTDSVGIELQWGTLTNLGTIDFGDGSAGYADLGLRGDWSQHNDYYFNGVGNWRLHDLLIGRNSSRLQPAPVGSPGVPLVVQGDFENYDEFIARNAVNEIAVIMGGRRRQRIMGHVAETAGATTTFHNLVINNANGLGDYNNSADVWFESFGGGNIDYVISGSLAMVSGDLVTRDRTTNNVHNLTLLESATTNNTFVHSNMSPAGSSFVDGPLRWEVENAGLVSRTFPVGKTKTIGGYAFGDARILTLEVDHDAATRTTYTVEHFLDDRRFTYTWPSPIPELITWISPDRYWNVTKGAGANVQTAFVTLSYDLLEVYDPVTNPGGLRIVKDDGASNWVNIAVGGGGSGVGTGTIRSNAFTSFSDFTLASIDGLLPIQLLAFDAHRVDAHVDVDWTTVLELNTDYFEVERSLDRIHFTGIGRVEAAGNSAEALSYHFEDHALASGVRAYHYRLRNVDLDGAVTYSEIKTVLLDNPSTASLGIYPNPTTGDFRLILQDWPAGAMELTIVDPLGRLVAAIPLDGNATHPEIHAHLAPGVYLVQVRSGTSRRSIQLIVQ